jgi:hypothetical protein
MVKLRLSDLTKEKTIPLTEESSFPSSLPEMERKTQECKKFKFKEEKKNTGSLQGEI